MTGVSLLIHLLLWIGGLELPVANTGRCFQAVARKAERGITTTTATAAAATARRVLLNETVKCCPTVSRWR
jgi:hypothetical protein